MSYRSYAPRYGGGRSHTRNSNPYPAFGGSSARGGGGKISISNLDSEVTDGDVREIFQQVGRVMNAVVNYDSSGRSRGTAEVTFANAQIAAKAVQEYDRAEVDGRPMFLTLMGGSSSFASKVLLPRYQPRVQQRGNRGDRGGGRRKKGRGSDDFVDVDDVDSSFPAQKEFRPRGRRGRGGGRGGRNGRRRQKAPAKTAAELDKELEDYHKKTSSSSSSSSSGFTGQPSAPSDAS